jgi:hypothetical protein
MKKTIKKIVVLSAVLTFLASPAVFAAEAGTPTNKKQSSTQEQKGTQPRTSTQTGVGE